MYGRDRFIFPIFLLGDDVNSVQATRFVFKDSSGVDVTIVWEDTGYYYPCKDSLSEFPTLYEKLETLINDTISNDPQWVGQTYTIERGTAQAQGASFSGFLSNTSLRLVSSIGGIEARLSIPDNQSIKSGGSLGASLGIIPRAGSPWSNSNSEAVTSSTAMPGSIYGQWVPPVTADDKRRRPVSDVITTGPGSVSYSNIWEPQKIRRFKYRMVHPNHVLQSPLRRNSGSVTGTYGGLLPFDQGNKFQDFWESSAKGYDIIIIHDNAESDEIDIRSEDFEIGKLITNPDLKSVLTDENFNEHYEINFSVLLREYKEGY